VFDQQFKASLHEFECLPHSSGVRLLYLLSLWFCIVDKIESVRKSSSTQRCKSVHPLSFPNSSPSKSATKNISTEAAERALNNGVTPVLEERANHDSALSRQRAEANRKKRHAADYPFPYPELSISLSVVTNTLLTQQDVYTFRVPNLEQI
jgi:hypothetical protein